MSGKIESVSLIVAPFHCGIPSVGPGRGPLVLQHGVAQAIRAVTPLPIHEHQIPLAVVENLDGEAARIFAVCRAIAQQVAQARAAHSFPIILSGNCNGAVGVAAGLTASSSSQKNDGDPSQLGCLWFDAHDDFHTPDTLLSGYGDSMAIAMLAGRCYRRMLGTVPGHAPLDLQRLVHVGMRDVSAEERQLVTDAGFDIIWGSTETRVDFAAQLNTTLERKTLGDTMVHVDLDCLDAAVGRANGLASYGGLYEHDLAACLESAVARTHPVSLTLASYDPDFDEVNVPAVAIRCIAAFIQKLLLSQE